MVDIEKTKQERITDAQKAAVEKRAELAKAAAEKEASIIQQSMDRLRSAFASKTGFDIGDAFGSGATTGGLITKLKASLTGAKNLQANAAALAGKGYSQTFIEQVVKQGPELGNKLSAELLKATDEETTVLQNSFMDMEAIQETGLDALAKSMNSGASLATSQLRQAYDQVAIDLKASLATVDTQLAESLADANKAYSEAMVEAKATRDEALADAQKSLTEALTKAQKDYENAIDEIDKATQKKLDSLKEKLREVAAQIAALGAAQMAAAAMANAPVSAGGTYSTTGGITTPFNTGASATTNLTQNFVSNSPPSPAVVSQAAMSGIKYGNVVTATSNFTYGAGNVASKIYVAPKGAVLDRTGRGD